LNYRYVVLKVKLKRKRPIAHNVREAIASLVIVFIVFTDADELETFMPFACRGVILLTILSKVITLQVLDEQH
jgi:hypothetical protein